MAVDEEQSKSALPAQAAPQRADAVTAGPESYLSDFDTQLMLQYRAGRSEAANALIRRNLDRVARFVGRVVRDSRVVEDLVQDVFVQVLSRAQQYAPTARFSTWLFRIATNTALTHLRQAGTQKRRGAAALAGVDFPDRSQPLPDHALSLDELRERLAVVIDELPPNQRVALMLFETEDLSYAQIAQVLSVSIESVRALLMRARMTLRERLRALD